MLEILEPIRVLHVFGGLDAGGAESRTMDIYRQINKEKVQFDFLIHTEKSGFFEDEIIKMGGRIYRVPRYGISTIIRYPIELKSFFKKHTEYSIVHGHILSTAFIYLWMAKKFNVPIRIAHSRSGSRDIYSVENIIKEIFKRLTRFFSTEQFAVSRIAGISAFGINNINKNKVKIVPNAIDSKKYFFNEEIRKEIRSKMGLNDKFVIGHVGRFEEQKNHNFIIDVFNNIHNENPNTLLVLIGDGHLKIEIEKKVKKYGLEGSVIFTGIRSDVHNLLQAIDIILFPSFFEGLPGVILESQAAGLPCIISNKITEEVKITDLVNYVSLKKSSQQWAEIILKYSKGFKRENTNKKLKKSGYDIESVAKWYESYYIEKQQSL